MNTRTVFRWSNGVARRWTNNCDRSECRWKMFFLKEKILHLREDYWLCNVWKKSCIWWRKWMLTNIIYGEIVYIFNVLMLSVKMLCLIHLCGCTYTTLMISWAFTWPNHCFRVEDLKKFSFERDHIQMKGCAHTWGIDDCVKWGLKGSYWIKKNMFNNT